MTDLERVREACESATKGLGLNARENAAIARLVLAGVTEQRLWTQVLTISPGAIERCAR